VFVQKPGLLDRERHEPFFEGHAYFVLTRRKPVGSLELPTFPHYFPRRPALSQHREERQVGIASVWDAHKFGYD
jgi:hypothetical protein